MLIYPYNPNSESAKALAAALGLKRAKHEGKEIKKNVINWGASKIDRPITGNIINRPEAVAKAANKLTTLKILKEKGVNTPLFTESFEEASSWIKEGRTVVARTKLNAHSGEGIVIVDSDSGEELPEAKLYTMYVPKTEEYRIHIMGNPRKAIFIQRKARSKDVPDEKVNWKVRNHQNGFIYAHKDIDEDALKPAIIQAKEAVTALGLHFGAVDLIFNKKQGKYFVLEVNTACGLSGETINAYAKGFKELFYV